LNATAPIRSNQDMRLAGLRASYSRRRKLPGAAARFCLFQRTQTACIDSFAVPQVP
jgi:hypothetical protein